MKVWTILLILYRRICTASVACELIVLYGYQRSNFQVTLQAGKTMMTHVYLVLPMAKTENQCSLILCIQILEAADKIQAMDMKKHALNIIVHHFPKVVHFFIRSCNDNFCGHAWRGGLGRNSICVDIPAVHNFAFRFLLPQLQRFGNWYKQIGRIFIDK